MEKENIYQQHGYESREAYFRQLAGEYDVPMGIVIELSRLLGQDEDFDGLINALEEVDDYLS